MFQLMSVLLVGLITSPHHHRHMGPEMGPGMASGMGASNVVVNETEIYLDTNNNTDIENVNVNGNGSAIGLDRGNNNNNRNDSDDSNDSNGTDPSVSIGIGSSFGIVVLLICFLSLKGKKPDNDNIYLEPINYGESSSDHEVITNPNYEDIYNYDNDDDPEIIDIENKKNGNSVNNIDGGAYETICDTFYELAGNTSSSN